MALSSAVCVVLGTRVAVEFRAFRDKLVQSSIDEPGSATARVDLDAGRTSPDLRPPVAIIARVEHKTAATQAFTILIDGQTACVQSVRGGAPRRVDCAWNGPWDPTAAHAVEVVGPAVPWTLAALEVATHHGSTRGHDLLIVPASAQRYEHPSPTSTIVIFLLLTAIFAQQPVRLGRALGWTYRIAAGTAAILLFLVLLSPHVSRFAILISPVAFGEAAIVLTAPRLWEGGRAVVRQLAGRWRATVLCLSPALVVLAVYGSLVGYNLREVYHGNYSGFIQLSHEFFNRNPMLADRPELRASLVLNDSGYDGQFVYFEVFDPFLLQYKDHPETYGTFIDAPPYRYGRIGFSLLTRILSGGRWQQYPATMTWMLLVALFASALSLSLVARSESASPAWGLLVLFVPGFWQSLQVSLPEPIAAALLLGGYICLVRRRVYWAALLFGLSLLFRETGIILIFCLAAEAFIRGRYRESVQFGLLSLVPVVVWRLYLLSVLYADWGLRAFWYDPHDLTMPFAGFRYLWAVIRNGEYFPMAPDLARAGIVYPVLLTGGLAIAIVAAVTRFRAITVAAVVYGLIAVSLNYESIWVHIGNGQRGTYELFLMLALVAISARSYPRFLRLALTGFWAGAAAYVFVLAFDADYIRHAVLSWPF